MKKPILVFTLADKNFLPYAENLQRSFKHFHPDIPFEIVGGEALDEALKKDPAFFYRATPVLASQFIKDYETVIKIDSDSIITSDLSHIIEDKDEFEVGTVFNDLPLRVFDIETYYNCGLVVMKSEKFIDHWHRLCYSEHFNHFQYREQDLLSIITSDYFQYKVKCYDLDERLNGLIAKPAWSKCYMEDNKIMLDTPRGKKQLSVIHFAGGSNSPNKGNYRIRFQSEVVKYIDSLIK